MIGRQTDKIYIVMNNKKVGRERERERIERDRERQRETERERERERWGGG